MLQGAVSKVRDFLSSAALALCASLLLVTTVMAVPCDLKNSPPPFIRHDLTSSASTSNSYCELCSYGYVTIVISNPYEGVDMAGMTVVENLGSSGLTYDPTAPNPMTYSINGGATQIGAAPTISGSNGSTLTWTAAQIPALSRLDFDPDIDTISTIAITFAVTRAGGLSQEGLISATREIEASLTYSTDDLCFVGSTTVSTGTNTLPLREPNPQVIKRGRNVDAGQGSGQYSENVYGNLNDDVIWRIRVRNTGLADLQDLRFDDLMGTGNMVINYACPSESAATTIANNNGVDPGGLNCVAASNTISDFDVDNPFGNPGSDSPDLDDVSAGENGYIYLVGKIPNSPNGSCSPNRTNTVSDIQWGCQQDAPAGGITATSTGYTPPDALAFMSSLSVNTGNNLDVQTAITGTNLSQPAGSKGTVRITISNNTGGTVKGIKLRNVLPTDYVVDSTYTPTVEVSPAYGTYAGMTDNIIWTNPVAGTFPLTTTDPSFPLSNTAPEFTLTSTGCDGGTCGTADVHPLYSDQRDLLRHGDQMVVTFRIVLIRSESYDRTANLDVRTEAPTSDPPGTDPTHVTSLTNEVYTEFEDFCNPGVTKNPPTNPRITNHSANPEDLDINIVGSELIFILTNDPAQRLPLTVALTNNGGHDADDYVAYVSFGVTMEIVSAPSGCSVTTNPPPLPAWRQPALIPADATVYECTGSPIGAGATTLLNFEVVKKIGDPVALAADDLTFRADVIGEITLSDGTLLWFPTPTPRNETAPLPAGGALTDRANNYSLDGIRARVIGFNLLKSQVGTCTENNPPPASPDTLVQIGEECTYHIETGGWFGFQTPGFTYIAVQDIQVVDELPDGQGYISSTDPYATSTSAVLGISLNPASLAPLDEVAAPEWMNWTFNQVIPAERITEKDHWFRVNMTSRLLNDPIDSSAAPNEHAALSRNVLNSYFQGVFFNDSTGLEEVYDLGPGTVGYPRVEVRRFDLTVTEPELTVVKEVCNETLYGTGPTCSNFVPLATDGDAYNSYIYRLTITNEAASGGVTRAPAYDVIVTDQLDASDLAYVLPFAGDGLDNDADGASGGADAGGEGTISDNVVKNGTPAELTFSYTHSTALEKIDPGDAVRLYYRVDYDDDAAPLQLFTNTASASYDSLTGHSGNQSAPQQLNSHKGGARVYQSADASASVRVIPVVTQPKTITRLSNTPLAGGGHPQGVVPGEEIEYQLNTLLPVALLRDFVIRDELPAGLRCSEAPAVNLNAAPYSAANFVPGGIITPTCTDTYVEWDFGDQRVTSGTTDNRYDFAIRFIARVENSALTDDGLVIANGQPATNATARYIDETSTLVTLDFGQVEVTVQEPRIELTKAFDVVNADAGDQVTVTVTATNTGTAPAYNLRVLDDLTSRNLTFIQGSVSGTDPPTVDITTFGANQPIFTATNPIAAGANFSFTFKVSVDVAAQPLEELENTLQSRWTSLPGQTTALNSSGTIGTDGAIDGMRIGSLPNGTPPLGINDYETGASSAVITVPPVTLTKTDLAPTTVPTIGAHKQFEIVLALPEGTTQTVQATDNLNAGGVSYLLTRDASFDVSYTFDGIATINGQPPSETAFLSVPSDGSTGNVQWNIGDVVTATEDDLTVNAISPRIVITYYGRVNNDTLTDQGDTLQNGVTATYRNGETGGLETLNDNTAAVTAVEPLLVVDKALQNLTRPDTDPVQGGDLLEYTLTIPNSGQSTAFDVNIVDSLPDELVLQSGTQARIDGNPVAGFNPTPTVNGSGYLVWGRDNGDTSLVIPAGSTLVVTYQARVDEIRGDLNNTLWVDWTSLAGPNGYERTGENCPSWTAPNDYCSSDSSTQTTVDNTSLAKAYVSDSYDSGASTATDAIVRVGDTVIYRLSLNLPGGITRDVRVEDQLPAGLVFDAVISINGSTTAPYAANAPFTYTPIDSAQVPTAGQTGTLVWDLGSVRNAAGATDLDILYRAKVVPDAALTPPSTNLTNTAYLYYIQGNGAPAPTLTEPRLTDNATIEVVQPSLTVTKASAPVDGSVVGADQLVNYTVEIVNGGSAPAYDAVLEDIIPAGMRNGAATLTMVSTQLVSGAVRPNLTPVYDPATGVVTWDFGAAAADLYTIPPGDALQVVYQVQVDSNVGAGLTMTNQAQVPLYYSFDDGAVPPAGGGVDDRQAYGPSNIASTTLVTAASGVLNKATTQATAAIGEQFTYVITVPATPVPSALQDVQIFDDLTASAADLRFVSVAKLSPGGAWTPVNTGTDTNVVIAGGIDIPANEQIQIAITVELLDTANNLTPGLTFTNSAWYSYSNGTAVIGDPPTTGGTSGSMTVVHPELTLSKTGPATMQVGVPDSFLLTVENVGAATAWNTTVTDRLPNPTPGGMCATPPIITSAVIRKADSSTLTLTASDYTLTFTPGAPTCEFTVELLTPVTVLEPTERLELDCQVELDVDSVHGSTLTNIAGATEWFSAEASVTERHAYTPVLTDGTPGTVDHQDAHEVLVEAPILVAQKTVDNVTTGAPGTNANPGDRLRYTITINNVGTVPLNDFILLDELDRLNASAMFQPGSLTIVTMPGGADTSNTDVNGGALGTGLLDVRNLSIAAGGNLTFVFEATLAPVIANGTLVLNQGQLSQGAIVFGVTDDPAVVGDSNPTQTLIASAPVFQVEKTVDQRQVYAGSTLRYVFTVKNIGDEDAVNVVLQDALPPQTTYVANSTTLNGASVPDVSGASPLQSGTWLIYAPENPTPGEMRADASATTNNVATITFEVVVNADVGDSTLISNQGQLTGAGSGSGVFPAVLSDDPTTAAPLDPTVVTVLQPNGIVYDSVRRQPIAGVTLAMLRASTQTPLPASCFSDPAQQYQVTTANGAYKFDVNFSQPECSPGTDFNIAVTAVPNGYVAATSQIILPTGNGTVPYSVPDCTADALPATTYCEAQATATAPAEGTATTYYQHLLLNNVLMPQTSQIFNNHLPVDPEMEAAIEIIKTSSLVNVTRGQIVPYTISIKNRLGGVIDDLSVVDTLPPGFKYVEGSSRFDGVPLTTVHNGRQLRWENLSLNFNEQHTITLLAVVGAGVTEGKYVNRAQVINDTLGTSVSAEATATVRVIPDPTFDCTDVIGKVFDDRDLNGAQTQGEKGLSGVRVVTARGLIATTDQYGRFHITCAVVPDEDRGSNFILKLDDRSLPSGYRMTTSNPQVQRATRGKMMRYNFGATIHRVVGLDIADGVFEPKTTELRPQWRPKISQLLTELKKSPSVLRLSYLADIEREKLVKARVKTLKRAIAKEWKQTNGGYRLTIETEIFWRRGEPVR